MTGTICSAFCGDGEWLLSAFLAESPDYLEWYDLWAKGKCFLTAYGREKIQAVTKRTLVLEPVS